MKGLKLGYDQLDNGEKIYAKFPLNFYGKFISKITTQDIPEEKSILKLYKLSSSSGNKYALKFHNFFFFKLHQESLSKKITIIIITIKILIMMNPKKKIKQMKIKYIDLI